mgnify:CR=1 FL=1
MVDKKTYDKTYHKEQCKKYYLAHHEKMKAINRAYVLLHRGQKKVYDKEYRLLNQEKRKKDRKEYRLANCKRIKAKKAADYLANKERIKKRIKNYKQTPKGKEVLQKTRAKRRQFGFTTLNKPFKGSHAHHIDKERVIYIPKELHHSMGHSVTQNRGMNKINIAAVRFLKTNELKLFY